MHKAYSLDFKWKLDISIQSSLLFLDCSLNMSVQDNFPLFADIFRIVVFII